MPRQESELYTLKKRHLTKLSQPQTINPISHNKAQFTQESKVLEFAQWACPHALEQALVHFSLARNNATELDHL